MASVFAGVAPCSNCTGTKFEDDWHNGDSICITCGAVQPGRLIDQGEEKRKFTDNPDDPHRTSTVNTFLRDGLGTTISKDPSGGRSKISKLHQRMVRQEDRNLLMAFDRLNQIADVLGLSDAIKNQAKEIYKQFEAKRTKFARSKRDGIAAAVLYMACKEANFPRTFKELSKKTEIEEKDIRKYYCELKRLLARKAKATSPKDLVPRICSNLGLPKPIENWSVHVAQFAVQFVEGKHPNSIAAASILLVCNLTGGCTSRRYERDIADKSNVATTTLKSVYKELFPRQANLMPADWRQDPSLVEPIFAEWITQREEAEKRAADLAAQEENEDEL